MKKRNIALGFLTVMAVSFLMTGCKVIDTGTEGQYTGQVAFNAKDSAAAIWDQAVDEVTRQAVDLKELLNESDGDLKNSALIEKYNGQDLAATKNAAANVVVYAVKGSGIVTEVNSKSVSDNGSTMGTITLQLDDYSGSDTIKISVGPKLKKTNTSLRDYLSFVSLGKGEYGDTVKWAELAASLNEHAVENVISEVDLTAIDGKEVNFIGTFTTDATHPDEIIITPVELEEK
jgi:predicted lipoprotein